MADPVDTVAPPAPPSLAPGLTYLRFLSAALRRSFSGSWRFYAWMTVLTAIALVGLNGWGHQLQQGMQVTRMSDHVSWGLYIANFTFGVGLAAGAVMMVIPAYLYDDHDMHDVVIIGELLAIAAIAVCIGIIVADMGRPDRMWHILPGIGRFHWPVEEVEAVVFDREPRDFGKAVGDAAYQRLLYGGNLEKSETKEEEYEYAVEAIQDDPPQPLQNLNLNNLPSHFGIMRPTILAIESSCDETSASVICNGKVLNNIIASQNVHHKYGGVVPELASRAHLRQVIDVVDEAMRGAGVKPTDLDAVAFTRGPGLMGALLVGGSFAKGLAWASGVPLITVDHMQAHILAHFIEEPAPQFPFLCLTVSGGHTQLVVVNDYDRMTVIGETQDDAAGEAFDKAAKILGLPYPGGPLIDRHAQGGNPSRYTFPDTDMPGLDFSFSGIKTAFLYFIRDHKAADPEFVAKNLSDICASLQAELVQAASGHVLSCFECFAHDEIVGHHLAIPRRPGDFHTVYGFGVTKPDVEGEGALREVAGLAVVEAVERLPSAVNLPGGTESVAVRFAPAPAGSSGTAACASRRDC